MCWNIQLTRKIAAMHLRCCCFALVIMCITYTLVRKQSCITACWAYVQLIKGTLLNPHCAASHMLWSSGETVNWQPEVLMSDSLVVNQVATPPWELATSRTTTASTTGPGKVYHLSMWFYYYFCFNFYFQKKVGLDIICRVFLSKSCFNFMFSLILKFYSEVLHCASFIVSLYDKKI